MIRLNSCVWQIRMTKISDINFKYSNIQNPRVTLSVESSSETARSILMIFCGYAVGLRISHIPREK